MGEYELHKENGTTVEKSAVVLRMFLEKYYNFHIIED